MRRAAARVLVICVLVTLGVPLTSPARHVVADEPAACAETGRLLSERMQFMEPSSRVGFVEISVDPSGESEAGESDSGGLGIGPLIAFALLVGVFVGGLVLIRRQRDSGRTSKFPRLG